ncbi:hypothetical protein V6R85_24165 [Agrobacterium sp. CCNWLW32]|uniref:hypothetical protein n=1 Tax=Agrobacterium sp. CCNWLW32 TaxID=3122072 RepID=UPI00300FF81B
MTTVAAHINEFVAEFDDVIPSKPRNVAIDSFAKIEKAAARARKANPGAPDFRKAHETRSPKGFFFDPAKRLDLADFDGLGW